MMPAAKGTCQLCATAHEPHEAHNKQSLYYAVRFQAQHGRSPTWADAVAHCSPEIIAMWKEELGKRHVWDEPKDGKPIAEAKGGNGEPKLIPLPSMEPKTIKAGRRGYTHKQS